MTTPTYPGVTITRNSDGVPHIVASNMVLAAEAYGFIEAFDRPFQLFLNYKAANGELSSVFGPSFIAQDTAVLKATYTKEDLVAQFIQWPKQQKDICEAYMKGVNAYYKQVLDGIIPIPAQFTFVGAKPQLYAVADLLRFLHLVLRQNSSNSSLMFQLSNLELLMQLKMKDAVNAEALFADIKGVNGVTKSRWTLSDGDACAHPGNGVSRGLRPLVGANASNFVCGCINKYIKDAEENEKLLSEHNINLKLGSRSVILGQQKVIGGGTLSVGGSQAGQGAPSPLYLGILDTPNWKMDAMAVVGGALFCFSPAITHDNFSFNYYLQVGTFHSRDLSIEPKTNAVPYATYSVQVRGMAPITVVAERSTTTGTVLSDFAAIPGYMIVERNPFLGTDFIGAGILTEHLINAKNFNDVKSYLDNPQVADIFGMIYTYHDSDGNTGAIHMGARTTLPETVNRKLPQVDASIAPFLVNNPIVPITDYKVSKPAASFNERPFYTYWNGSFFPVQDTNIYDSFEYQRVCWLYNLINRYTSLTYDQLKELITLASDSKLLQSGNSMVGEPNPTNTLNNSADAFVIMKDVLFAKILASPSTQRLSILNMLLGYDGRWIGGTSNVVSGRNVLDEWMLANSWIAQIIKNVFGNILPASMFLDLALPWVSVHAIHLTPIISLLIRILHNPCNNPIYYGAYPSGQQLDDIVGLSLEQAYEALNAKYGQRPWGVNIRKDYVFSNSFLGPIGSIPYLQHGSHESRADIRNKGVVSRGHLIAPGVSENISLTAQGPVPNPFFKNLLPKFQSFEFVEFGSKLKPSSASTSSPTPFRSA